MHPLDALVGFFSPQAGLRRARSRAAMEIVARGYDGADRGRLAGARRTPSTSADAELAREARTLRDRMRDLERNNPHAANAIMVLVTHAIGDGIVPRCEDERLMALFERWSARCDADGDQDVYGLQAQAARQMFVSGDGFLRRRRRLLSDGLPVPLQLQVIETDLIDDGRVALTGGNRIVQGVEFDGLGRRRGYWLWAEHPGNYMFAPGRPIESRLVPAEDIAHVFEKQRTQVRGAPWGAPIIASLYDLAEYEKAEIVRKRLESCLVGVLHGGEEDDAVGVPVGPDGNPLKPGLYNVDGARADKFVPGMFYNAVGGRNITFSTPAPAAGYDAYKTSMLHTIAAGFRMPYALLSGRLDKVNYSSSKVGLEAFKRTISALQWQFIIPMLCEPIWRWFCEAAWQAGHIPSPDVPVTWNPPKMYSADPLKDVKADIAEVRAGFRTPQSAILARGESPEAVLAGFRDWNAALDRDGTVFDSDPRKVSQAGTAQSADDGDPDAMDEDEEDEE